MKVVMNETNVVAYESLFQEFTEYLTNNGVGDHAPVTNLVGYFKALNACIERNIRPPFKYYRVPIDEPTFDVNMDTRTITVPQKFVQYGLGVQGDVNAEIVIFKIDRLYDLMDLHRLVANDGCWVQWSHSGGKVTGNSEVILSDVFENTETVIVKDAAGNAVLDENGEPVTKVISNPYIYAAWVLSDKITSAAGNVDFALRFFTTATNPENGKKYIDYSVSTQRASCKVNAALNLPIEGVEVETLEELILSRPIYSGVINSMNGASPRITKNLIAGTYDLSVEGAEAALYNEAFPNGVLKLEVAAESPDDKDIVYQWYSGRDIVYNPLDNENYDAEIDPDKKFGALATGASYIATTAGTYFCKIGNSDKDSGVRWIDSASIEIPAASEIYQNPDKLKATFPIQTYSIQKDTHNIPYTKLHFDVLGANGTVEYDWNLTDLAGNPIEDEDIAEYGATTDGVFVPVEGVECVVSVAATNHKNNTVSKTIHATNSEGTTCTYRAMPVAPTEVVLEYAKGNPTMTAVPHFDETKASSKHKDEWYYQWSYSKNGTTQDVPSTFINQTDQSKINMELDYLLKKPTDGTAYTTYGIRCRVGHTVFKKIPSLKVIGDSKASEEFELRVYADGTIQLPPYSDQ